jgi:hypothetical protein
MAVTRAIEQEATVASRTSARPATVRGDTRSMTAPSVNGYLEKARGNRAHAEWLFATRSHDQVAL